jgi:uncharacterized protein (DUF952 family)/alpha-beta hydrolase superfamily lysophospholipase
VGARTATPSGDPAEWRWICNPRFATYRLSSVIGILYSAFCSQSAILSSPSLSTTAPANRQRARFRRLRKLALGAGVAIALWLLISFAAAYRLTRRPKPRFDEPAPIVTWGRIESIRLKTRDGEDIGGWFVPSGDAAPSVLLLHGNKGSRRNSLERAEKLVSRGCAVLMISLRGHGDSSGDRNDIGFSARHDVQTAVDYLEHIRPGRPIVVDGVSMGSAAAIFAAGDLAQRVRGYILESPYRDLKTAVRNRTREALPPVLDWVAYQGLVIVSPLLISNVDAISPLNAIDGIPNDVPVLILAGAKDQLAQVDEATALHGRVKSHGQLVVFERAGHHNLVGSDPVRYWRLLDEFLGQVTERALSSRASPRTRKEDKPMILHIIKRADWDAAIAKGAYAPESLHTEGFIHCSTPDQVIRTANRFFAGQSELIVLNVDPSRVRPEIRWELPTDDAQEKFPHIYGPLNLDAVTGLQALNAAPSGAFDRLGPVLDRPRATP